MTTQTIEKNEDLIILNDETSTDNSILDFNIDNTNNVSNEETVLSFDDEKKDNNIDLFEDKKEEIWEDIFGVKEEVKDLEENEKQEEVFIAQDLWDRNDILDWTIKQLEQRKNIVWQVKQTKQSSVWELNEKIAKLKKEVEILRAEIKDLEKEEDSIDLDITSIEKMKLNSLPDRQRQHNLGNIKKI